MDAGQRTGTRMLKQSQVYPQGYAKKILRSHRCYKAGVFCTTTSQALGEESSFKSEIVAGSSQVLAACLPDGIVAKFSKMKKARFGHV